MDSFVEDWTNDDGGMAVSAPYAERNVEPRGKPSWNRDGGRQFRRKPDRSNDLKISVPSDMIGKIIGRGGAKIRELQDESGTKINIDQDSRDSDVRDIFISGAPDAQECAKQLIEALTESRSSRAAPAPVEPEPYVQIDWGKVFEENDRAVKAKWDTLPPIKKDFYNEDPEVAGMSPEFVAKFRKEKNAITVKNVFEEAPIPIPNPVVNFEQAFRDYPEILAEIEKLGFKEPSPIQCQAWPILLSGRDLIGIAQTGTGKTLAFLLPALIHIEGQPIPRGERIGPNVLIIAPTRELALQIEEEVKKYSYRGIKSVCIYGGGNRAQQIATVGRGVEIIIATPGRLNDLTDEGVIDVSGFTYLVLDEADRMLDMGFEPQIRKFLIDIRPDRQVIMTSATWPPGVRTLAERYMTNPVQIFVGSLDLAAVHSVVQTVLIVDPLEKKDYLLDFINKLEPEDKVIIFAGRKVMVDHISSDLAFRLIDVQSIHGDRCQEDREQAIQDLKSGAIRILIATDVASRGLDITDITKVFNYDFPRNIEEYVHRVGRTGRAGKHGEAISLFTREDWAYAGELIDILVEANQAVPEELFGMKERFGEMKARRDAERASDGGGGGGRRFGGGGGGGRGGGGGGRGGRRNDRW